MMGRWGEVVREQWGRGEKINKKENCKRKISEGWTAVETGQKKGSEIVLSMF